VPYVPSPVERRRFRDLLSRRVLGPTVYRQYRKRVEWWIFQAMMSPPAILMDGQRVPVTNPHLRRSKLFGRDYLVGYVETERMREARPQSQAFAVSLVDALAPRWCWLHHHGNVPEANRLDRYSNMSSFK
jgi:hypothetical protein